MADNFRDHSLKTNFRSTDFGGLHTPHVVPTSYQKRWRDSFPGAAIRPTMWDTSVGAGGAISVAGGILTLNAGVNANSETWLLSRETFTVPFRVTAAFALSQRIANNTFLIEAVSVNPVTGLPDGQSSIAWFFDGTVATNGRYRVQNSGGTPLDSGAVTTPTTALAIQSVFEFELYADEAWFHGSVMDAATGRANSYRRHQQIPDPDLTYKVRVRSLNGGVAPASATTLTAQFVSVMDFAEVNAEINGGRGQSAAGQSLAVNVIGAVAPTGTTAVSVGAVATTPLADTTTPLGAGATFTGTARDFTAAPQWQRYVASAFADQSGTLVIEMSTDNVTWRRAAQIAVGAGEGQSLSVPVVVRYYRTVFINGGTAQGAFMLNSAFHRI